MAEEEKIRIELEVPKNEVQIESISSDSPAEEAKEAKKKASDAEKKVKELQKIVKEVQDQSEEKEEDKDDQTTIAGYKPSEIAKAPVDSPEPDDKRGPNEHQKTVIIFGVALVLVSIFLWPLFSFWIFVVAAVCGGVVIAFGSLVRV